MGAALWGGLEVVCTASETLSQSSSLRKATLTMCSMVSSQCVLFLHYYRVDNASTEPPQTRECLHFMYMWIKQKGTGE